MANIRINKELSYNLITKEQAEEVQKAFIEAANLASKAAKLGPNVDWSFNFIEHPNDIVVGLTCKELDLTVMRYIRPKTKRLDHSLFVLGEFYQSMGLNDIIAKASIATADVCKLNLIDLHANLDVGGYAWLRKGAWPSDGVNGLKRASKVRRANLELSEEFLKLIDTMSPKKIKAFVLTEEFRKYKPLFLKSDWYGAFDVRDPVVRAAMVGILPESVPSLPKPPVPVPMTSNEVIQDDYIRHQTYLLRYAGGLRNQVSPALIKTEKALYDSVMTWIAKADGNRTLTGQSGRAWQSEFEKALLGIRTPAWAEISKEVQDQLTELASLEVATAAKTIEGALPVVIGLNRPPVAQLLSIVNSEPFQGHTLKQWLDRTARADVDRLLSYAKVGVIQGQTPTQVARGIVGTKGAGYSDSISRKAIKDLESVILTLTNGIQNESKQALYEANADIIKQELFANTLDNRTSLPCIGAGEANEFGLGKGIYPRGQGPIPPLHFRCRSIRIPYINADSLGNRGFDSSTEKELLQEYTKNANLPPVSSRDALPRGYKTEFDSYARARRRELVGQVPATTTYGEWFKTQTTEFQDQVLGSTRGEMFRNGGISLDKFTARDGDVLTLDELKRKGLGSFGSPSQSVLGFNNPTTIVEKGVSFSTNPIPRMWTNRLPKTYKDSVNIDLADRDRLLDITLASNIKESVVKSIPLSKIRTYQGLVERERVNAMALDFSLAEYKKKGRAVLFQLPDGSYLLHDGNHRVGAAMSSGLKDLEFEVRKLVKSK